MTADAAPDADADTRRALRLCLARLGTDAARLIVAYYDFGDSSEVGEARRVRRRQLAIRLGLSDTALRARALAIRDQLEACVQACRAGSTPDAVNLPEWAEPDAEAAARDAERESETDRHDAYAREQLTVAEHAEFARWLSARPDQQVRQGFARALRPAAESAPRRPRAAPPRPRSESRRGTLLVGAAIAAVLALTLSLNPQWLAPAAPADGVAAIDTAAPTVLLLAPSADAPAAMATLALAPRARELRLQAEIRHDEEARLYRLQVLPDNAADDAPPLFVASDLPLRTVGSWRHVEALLPADVLRNGRHLVRIEAQPPAGRFRVDWLVRATERTAPDYEVPPP